MCFGSSDPPQPAVQPAPAPPAPSALAKPQDPTAPRNALDLNAYGSANGGIPNTRRPDDSPVATGSVTTGTGLGGVM